MAHPVFSPSCTALITGAASGIGLAVAQKAASYGMKLALVDINPENLATARSSLSDGGGSDGGNDKIDVECFVADVSSREDWKSLKVKVGQRFGGVNFLMLNAAVAPTGGFEDIDYFHEAFDTNVFGLINGLATFLPAIKSLSASGQPTAIVVTGSKQGITNPPGNPAYNASKAAVKSLAEQLSFELREQQQEQPSTAQAQGKKKPVPTSVHLLVPGWTFTGMTGGGSNSLREKPPGAWEPRQVADFLDDKMGKGQFYIICPDNDVDEDLDKRRILWCAGDIIDERPPLSRWREDWKEKASKGIEKMQLPG